MKTIKTLAICAALFSGMTSYTQNTTIGLTGGYNLTTYELFDFQDPYNGWNLGLTGVWSSQSNWGIGGDVIYSRMGGTYIQNLAAFPAQTSIFRVQTDYVRVTPKFQYFFGDLDDNLRPTLFIGPSLGIFVRSEEFSGDVGWRDDFNPLELAGVVGGGVNYQMVPGLWLHANVNYMMGITKLNSSNYYPNDLRTNNLGVSLGLAYSINKVDN